MRLSVLILVFLLFVNGWAALLQAYDVDDHLGINAETGDPQELQEAQDKAKNVTTNSGGITGSTTGLITTVTTGIGALVKGVNPAAQMLSNIAPPGITQDIILWLFGVTEIIVAVDIINFARGIR